VDGSGSPHFRLIIGLGNPGKEYATTRHNIGFMILDAIAAETGFRFRADVKLGAEFAPQAGVIYAKPLRFMNLSGQPVGQLAHYYKILPEQILIIADDAALPLGKLRLRPGGSAGGHNGLQSIIEALGTDRVPRLRFGIGAAADQRMTDHVLGRFDAAEWPLVEENILRARAAVGLAQEHGLEAAMNQFN
jgi:PTH1 family peptidyl-tRNA hydrolase